MTTQQHTEELVAVVAFSSHARILGDGKTIPSPPALYFFFFFIRLSIYLFIYFEVESACPHQFHFLGQDQSIVVQRAKITVAEHSLTSCV